MKTSNKLLLGAFIYIIILMVVSAIVVKNAIANNEVKGIEMSMLDQPDHD